MKQYTIIEGTLMGLLSVDLKLDVVSRAYEIADFNSVQFPETITENQYNLMKTGINLYDALLDIVETIKNGNNISSSMIENAIIALKNANVMSEDNLTSIIGGIGK